MALYRGHKLKQVLPPRGLPLKIWQKEARSGEGSVNVSLEARPDHLKSAKGFLRWDLKVRCGILYMPGA